MPNRAAFARFALATRIATFTQTMPAPAPDAIAPSPPMIPIWPMRRSIGDKADSIWRDLSFAPYASPPAAPFLNFFTKNKIAENIACNRRKRSIRSILSERGLAPLE